MDMKILSVSKPDGWNGDYRIETQWRQKHGFFGVATGVEVFRGRGTVFMSETTGRRPCTLIESLLSDALEWSKWKKPLSQAFSWPCVSNPWM